MKKLTTAADLGGAPIYKSDLRNLFNVEIWDVIQGAFSNFNSNTEGFVLQGCVTTANGGNFDISAGIVYLNGEFMRVAAVVNTPFTRYIAPDAAVNDSRPFQDGSNHTVMITKTASLYSAAPGSGQYIRINSLTDLDDRRWLPLLNQVDTAYITTGLSYSNGGAAGTNFGIRITARNTVRINGILQLGSGSNYTAHLTYCTLPAGYRPSYKKFKPIYITPTGGGSELITGIEINTNGDIQVGDASAGGSAGPYLAHFDDFEFEL